MAENSSYATPSYFVDKITDIDPAHLKNMGVEVVCIDLDNTTVYDSTLHSIEGVKAWIKKIKASGIKIIILTNTFTLRAKFFAMKFGHLPYVAMARKPSIKGFARAKEIADVPYEKIAMIGDQLFTDIEGANKAGMISIKVRLSKQEVLFGKRFRRIRRREHNYLRKRGFGSDL